MEHALVSESSNSVMFTERNDTGLLIAFEGPDGSGKTTQRKLFKSWLHDRREDVVVTKWNSSPVFKPIIKAKKAARLLDPASFATLHAADFWHRYETVIQPALADGKIVLADRYAFTGIARDVARGMNPDWCMELYAGVRKPDIVFYFKASVTTCTARISASREMKFYEAGQDVTGLEDASESYRRFCPRVVSEYENLHKEFGFVTVDAEQSVDDQHRFIRQTYLEHWTGMPSQPVLEPQLHPSFAQS